MTHADIYEKFMIEYDKENITTSYPSLTEYEIATLLDKAYLALIAQKFTGNNIRGVGFEGDEKAVEDLQPLIATDYNGHTDDNLRNGIPLSQICPNMLYIVSVSILKRNKPIYMKYCPFKYYNAFQVMDDNWMKNPLYTIYGNKFYYCLPTVDHRGNSINLSSFDTPFGVIYITYIKKPAKFVNKQKPISLQTDIEFELSDSMAEELINLALVMATEIVESPRMQTKAQMRGFES